ncbi:universal stress protein [Lacinutrix sp. Bg11-31]|uniref:universal stress protein n=1 Tax=Lacinutrix sp. Bg11-31 TaxID=2057808 RepID=UPI000C3114AA|nr:universal stress protein [Lacinutrix sp. Bg11-31]AUC81130.1 universal stress protein [Lacinutrix sp. Bg11-31]
MRHKILLPTDFSKNASKAIEYALELYKDDVCDFYLLNVFYAKGHLIESLINLEPGSGVYEIVKEESQIRLQKIIDGLLLGDNVNPKHQFKSISKFNNTVETIKNVVEEKDIEMIVMGTKGKTNARKVAYGSIAINVMEKVRNCPVIAVPEDAKLDMPKEIVFPTSYKTHFKRRELIYLIDIAKKCKANIAVLHISNEDKLDQKQLENIELLKEYFKEVTYSVHNLLNNNVETAVGLFVESRASDMVAFINKKHAFFGSILTQPLVKDITYLTNVPILVMHDLRN